MQRQTKAEPQSQTGAQEPGGAREQVQLQHRPQGASYEEQMAELSPVQAKPLAVGTAPTQGAAVIQCDGDPDLAQKQQLASLIVSKVDSYLLLQANYVSGTNEAISDAEQNVRDFVSLSDSHTAEDAVMGFLLSALDFVPGGLGFKGIVQRWGAGAFSSGLVEKLVSSTPALVQGAAANASNVSGANAAILSQNQVSQDASAEQRSWRESYDAEVRDLDAFKEAVLTGYLSATLSDLQDSYACAVALYNGLDALTAAYLEQLVDEYEKQLWLSYIAQNCSRVDDSGSIGFWLTDNSSNEIVGMSTAAQVYVTGKFGASMFDGIPASATEHDPFIVVG